MQLLSSFSDLDLVVARSAVLKLSSAITSFEDPVESALAAEEVRGWRTADSGTQTIRLMFDQPQELTRIALVFDRAV